jgi:hypothetical protein
MRQVASADIPKCNKRENGKRHGPTIEMSNFLISQGRVIHGIVKEGNS